MSQFLTIARAIETRFATNFTAASIAYDNVPFEIPDASAWVRLSVTNGPSQQVAMGATKQFRHTGLISVQVFVPLKKGAQAAHDLADKVSDVWRGASFSGIVARVPSVTVIGARDGWYQVNVTTPFYSDEYAAT